MKKFLKWLGLGFGGLIGLILVAGVVLYLMGNARFEKVYSFPTSNIVIPTDAASIELGKHRAETLCQGCHGDDLGGINNWFAGGPLGTIDSANLTSGEGGIGKEFTSPEDYVRAIRHGINREGKPIFMLAVASTAHLSDQELGAIIAYLKTVPPVDRITYGNNLSPLTKIMLAAGMLGQLPVEEVSHDTQIEATPVGVSVEYGEYLVNINDCRICHGKNLAGGPHPDPTIQKISPNLTPGGELAYWSEAQFIETIRTGVTPSGSKLDQTLMPWDFYQRFYDDELKAIFMYLQAQPKLPQYTR
jgi:mono/diheme cytochrome c family protein